MSMEPLTWIEISKDALSHNMGQFRRLIGNSVVLAPAVKANAYGHGLREVASVCAQAGADWLCVKAVEEAELLRATKIDVPLLSVGYVQISDLMKAVELSLRIGVYSRDVVSALSEIGRKLNRVIPIHVKIDTGMTRFGILPRQVDEFISYVESLAYLKIEGVFTHFANSDEWPASVFFQMQVQSLQMIKERLGTHLPNTIFHSANSAALLQYPESHLDMVRPGIALYGLYPSKDSFRACEGRGIVLRPVLSLKTRVAQVKAVARGCKVSYGCTEEVKRDTIVAVLPIGYCDGIDRKLSRIGYVLIRGRRAKILGRVCMNLTVVDVTDIPDVSQEDEVVVIGQQGREEISADEVASLIGTINYEVTTRLRETIPRFVV